MDENGQITIAKAPSTPGNFAEGVIEAISRAAAKIGKDLPQLLDSISVLAHGTTVGTNPIIQRRGAKVGLITTKGHNQIFTGKFS